ncbi:hypothetical protein [Mesorhizobium sp. M0847]|uniref:hypothetical protein n=1 Tax=unclassified Mesorhizobium TaxID=325217 RepID=UPI0033382958
MWKPKQGRFCEPAQKNRGKSASESDEDRIGGLRQGAIRLRLADVDDLLPVSGE